MADQEDDPVDSKPKIKALPGGGSRLKLIPLQDLKLDTARHDLVRGILPQSGLVVIWGPPKCGKSFWVTDLLLHASLGWPYRGRKTQAGNVLYCAFEGQGGIPPRVAALRQRYTLAANAPLWFCREVVDVIRDYKSIIVAARELPGQRVNAVVLDTLNKSLFGSENKDEDMSAYIRACDAIASTLQCVVVIVHHCGTAGNRPRGHTALTGAVDVQLKVERKNKTVRVAVELAKDGPTGDVIVSMLEEAIVGIDDEGNPIKTALIVPADEQAAHLAAVDKLKARTRSAYDVLRKLLEKEGRELPAKAGPGAGLWGLDAEKFREALGRVKLINEKGNPRQQVKRYLDDLKDAGLIDVFEGHIWEAKSVTKSL